MGNMNRELLIVLLNKFHSLNELTPLSDDKLQDMFDKLKSKLDGDY